jgi:adenylate kinase family enzyme
MTTVQRILVAGISGVGKSTLSRRLATRLGVPFIELDALYHGPNWQPVPTFVEDVDAISNTDAWVIDSHGYPEVRDLLWDRADTVVWLDYPRRIVMTRVLRRSIARTLLRRKIFNGNREQLRHWFLTTHPARWAWRGYHRRRADMVSRLDNPRWAHLAALHFRHPDQTAIWLDSIPVQAAPEPIHV